MHHDKDSAAGADTPDSRGSRPRPKARKRRVRPLVPALVAGLATAAIATALIANRGDAPNATQAVSISSDAAQDRTGVVTAPPLKAPSRPVAQGPPANPESSTSARADAGPACRNCGVVQMVVAVHGYAQPQPSGFQMHIRMDDGSVRTIEQRGALAAGSRVIVERDSVRVLAQRPTQG